MDIILSRYVDARLSELGAQELEAYDALLSENDQDLYQWVTGQAAPPDRFKDMIADIARISVPLQGGG